MTLTERVKALEEEVKALREQLDARSNAHDYSGTTNSSTQLAAGPPRPQGYGRRFGFGLPEVNA